MCYQTSYNWQISHTHSHILPKVDFGRHPLCIVPIRLDWFCAGNVRRCCELDNEMLQTLISWFAWQCNTHQQLSWVLLSQTMCPVQSKHQDQTTNSPPTEIKCLIGLKGQLNLIYSSSCFPITFILLNTKGDAVQDAHSVLFLINVKLQKSFQKSS